MGFFERNVCRSAGGRVPATWLAVVLICGLFFVGPGFAQKKEKKKKDQSAQGTSEASSSESVRLPDDRAIDLAITEMLAGWQLGNVDLLHKHYADDVTVVSGVWEPPLTGWSSFLKAYQKQRERMSGERMDRSNTLIQVKGNLAWADYQWEFEATVDGQPAGARGHTTLVFEKRTDRWLIVHNHTSIVSEVRLPASAPAADPAKPAAPPRPGA
jgi:ketosteroid isomerase-like protein